MVKYILLINSGCKNTYIQHTVNNNFINVEELDNGKRKK